MNFGGGMSPFGPMGIDMFDGPFNDGRDLDSWTGWSPSPSPGFSPGMNMGLGMNMMPGMGLDFDMGMGMGPGFGMDFHLRSPSYGYPSSYDSFFDLPWSNGRRRSSSSSYRSFHMSHSMNQRNRGFGDGWFSPRRRRRSCWDRGRRHRRGGFGGMNWFDDDDDDLFHGFMGRGRSPFFSPGSW